MLTCDWWLIHQHKEERERERGALCLLLFAGVGIEQDSSEYFSFFLFFLFNSVSLERHQLPEPSSLCMSTYFANKHDSDI